MGFDKLKASVMSLAEKYTPGKDSLKGKVAIVTGATAGLLPLFFNTVRCLHHSSGLYVLY